MVGKSWQIHGRVIPKDGWFASTRVSRREYEPLGSRPGEIVGKGSDLFQIPKKMGLGWLWKFQEQVNYSELIRTSTFLICGQFPYFSAQLESESWMGQNPWGEFGHLSTSYCCGWQQGHHGDHNGSIQGMVVTPMTWHGNGSYIYIYIHTKHIDVNMSIQLHRAAIHNYIMINSNLIIEA